MTRLTAKRPLFKVEVTPLGEATRLVGIIVIANSENDDKNATAKTAAMRKARFLINLGSPIQPIGIQKILLH